MDDLRRNRSSLIRLNSLNIVEVNFGDDPFNKWILFIDSLLIFVEQIRKIFLEQFIGVIHLNSFFLK